MMQATDRLICGFSYVVVLVLLMMWSGYAEAVPLFARKYGLTCAACHAAFPRLNQFGISFRDNNSRLPNWKETTISGGDELLAIPDQVPIAFRAQGYVQARDAKFIDPVSGETQNANTDFQSPYLIKMISSAPLSDYLTYYFYGIFAERGGNGEVLIEDAWFRHSNIFNTGTAFTLGQYQLTDLMFPRENRLPLQDYLVYRFADITYDRGVQFDRGFGPVSASLGFVNGNGINANFDLNSPGLQRPDALFDNNNSKTVYGRLGTNLGPVNVGLFGADGDQQNATGPAGTESGNRKTGKRVLGLDASANFAGKWYWYAQYLWNSWDGFLEPGRTENWAGGFAGLDYIYNDRWVFSGLYNYADANDLDGSDTIYEGIDVNSLTFTTSYYFMRNVKGIAELNIDLLEARPQTGTFFTGHLTEENYILFGFDAAF